MSYKHGLVYFLFSFFSVLGGLQCEKPTPPDDKPHYIPSISLTAEDIGVTEAWLKVKFLDTTVNRTFKLIRDGQTVLTAQCSSLDTVVFDENLLPNHLYKYKAFRLLDSAIVDSAILTVTTMDTTSHNYTWKIDTLGDGNNSVLRDVAIINDTCVWVVGEIYIKDSTGQFETDAYNAVKWNGTRWELKRIPFVGSCSAVLYPSLRAIWAFSSNNILVSNGGSIVTYDGSNATMDCQINSLLTGAINKIFAFNSHDIYVVGNNDNIAHYNGSSWNKMESGTNVDLKDVWGSPDGSVVWVTGYYSDQAGTYLFKYDGISWKMVYDGTNSRLNLTPDSISGVISTVWTNSNNKVYVGAGAGVFVCDVKTKWKSKLITPFGWLRTLPHGMRANNINDIFIVGTYGFIGHYNGYTSKEYSQFWGTGRPFSAVAQKGNLVVAVGNLSDPINSKGLVFMGRR